MERIAYSVWRGFAAILIALTMTGVAVAQNVHLKPPNKNPSFVDGGLFLRAVGALAGLGSGDVLVSLTAQANVISTCTNPAGATNPPGQNPAPITVSGSQAIPASEVKNGNTSFNVRTESPPSTILGAPDCPNPQWTETITDLLFTSAVITVEQPFGTVVLTVSCTFTSPTQNGSVPPGNVVCQVS
jgi:hypothetical protein